MSTPTTPALETRDLGRRFGGLSALSDLSFSLTPGQVLGVIGPNGAGKSTFINLVTGHLRPSTGQVLVYGADLTGKRPWHVAAAGVARTFQIVKPFRGMTVRENVAISAMYGPPPNRSRRAALAAADEALEQTGFTAAHTATPNELSVADARRLELAKALALRPRLLLLDEVMAGLRGTEIDRCLELVHRLREEGMTIVVVEHLMKAILSVSDQVLVLHQGRQLILGEPQVVLSDTRVIEAYLGERYVRRKAR
jgi:branched-chain amino acid transport system ATP-binding protein